MLPNTEDKSHYPGLSLAERIERIYTFLEYIARYEANSFSNNSKANLRKAQADLQRLRLLIDDLEKSLLRKSDEQ